MTDSLLTEYYFIYAFSLICTPICKSINKMLHIGVYVLSAWAAFLIEINIEI